MKIHTGMLFDCFLKHSQNQNSQKKYSDNLFYQDSSYTIEATSKDKKLLLIIGSHDTKP